MFVASVPMLLNVATSTGLDFCSYCPVFVLMFQIFPLIFPPLPYKAHQVLLCSGSNQCDGDFKSGEKHSLVFNKDRESDGSYYIFETAVCIYQKG